MTSNKLYSQTFIIVDDENDNLKSLETSSLLINPTNDVSKSTYGSKPSFSVLEDSPSYNVRSSSSSISLINTTENKTEVENNNSYSMFLI